MNFHRKDVGAIFFSSYSSQFSPESSFQRTGTVSRAHVGTQLADSHTMNIFNVMVKNISTVQVLKMKLKMLKL
jgi:hypothetical protein